METSKRLHAHSASQLSPDRCNASLHHTLFHLRAEKWHECESLMRVNTSFLPCDCDKACLHSLVSVPCFIPHFSSLILKVQCAAVFFLCYVLCVMAMHWLGFRYVHVARTLSFLWSVCLRLRCAFATCISLLIFRIWYLFCSSWVWPFPWRCFIRSTEQERSTTPSRAPVQTEAFGTDSVRKAPLNPLHLLTWSPVLLKLLCTDISHASPFLLLFSSLSWHRSSAKEKERQRGRSINSFAKNPCIPFLYSFRSFFCMLGLTNVCRKENIMTTINCIALLMYNSHPARKGEDIKD